MDMLSTVTRMPTLFVSHGAPTLAIEDGPAHQFLIDCGKTLGKPKAILMLSAHFEASIATVTMSQAPGTIHDFGGFPDALYDITYPARGDPGLALRVSDLLRAGGLSVRGDETRGLDHGAWVPLLLMYPDAGVPVVQLSIDPRRDPAHHFRLGTLLQPLRDEGVLIIASGGASHNLRHVFRSAPGEPTPEWVIEFREWLAETIENDQRDDLVHYRTRAPHAAMNHPTEEHFLPLLSALGATEAGESRQRIHVSETLGALAMDAYIFGTCRGFA